MLALLTLLACGAALTIVLVVAVIYVDQLWTTLKRRVAYWVSRVLCATSSVHPAEHRALRLLLMQEPLPPLQEARHHTHGHSAAVRNKTLRWMNILISRVGALPYSVQMSNADQRYGIEGSRDMRWAKDFNVEPRSDPVGQRHIRVYNDVDYYLDMERELTEVVGPVMISTITPESVCYQGADYVYTFNQDGEIDMKISGGGHYRHRLFDWSGDSAVYAHRVLGVPVKVSMYSLEARRIVANKSVVLLTPLRSWSFPLSLLASQFYDAGCRVLNPLCEAPSGEKFSRLRIMGTNGYGVSVGRPDEFASAFVPAYTDSLLAIIARNSVHGITPAAVASHLPAGDDRASQAQILCDYHKAMAGHTPDSPTVYPNAIYVRGYTPGAVQLNFDPPDDSLEACMRPIIDGAFAPSTSPESEAAGITGRITSIQTRAEPEPCTMRDLEWLREFTEECVPASCLEPASVDEVFEHQDRPTQRRILEDASDYAFEGENHFKVFVKKEASAGVGSPRIITTGTGAAKLAFARFIYPVAEHLKQHSWWGIGRSNADLAMRVVEVCGGKPSVVNSDFSRFDGHVTMTARNIENAVYFRAYHQRYHEDLRDVINAHVNQSGRGMLGTKLPATAARGSGVADTSVGNTLQNGFIRYYAWRLYGASHRVAWDSIGLACGDDGLGHVPPAELQASATRWGHKLEIDEVLSGAPGVTFLARRYGPGVWHGDPNSCTDIVRAAKKFHVTPRVAGLSGLQKVREKVLGYLVNDAETPLIGDFCRAFDRVDDGDDVPLTDAQSRTLRPYAAGTGAAYPNRRDTWMLDIVRLEAPEFHYDSYMDYLNNADSVQQLMELPSFSPRPEPEIKIDAIFDGQVVAPPGPPPSGPAESKPHKPRTREARQSRPPRRERKKPPEK